MSNKIDDNFIKSQYQFQKDVYNNVIKSLKSKENKDNSIEIK